MDCFTVGITVGAAVEVHCNMLVDPGAEILLVEGQATHAKVDPLL